MYQRIMVPLDGSKLAECVLPHVEALAKGCDTQEVVLVTVTEPVTAEVPVSRPASQATSAGRSVTRVPITIGKEQEQADKYLHRIAADLREKGVKARLKVLVGDPANEIASYAESRDCDLIVICSHGRSGPSRWTHGNVADKVFRASCIPVLMVRGPGCEPGI